MLTEVPLTQCTHTNILVPDLRVIVRVGPEGVHPLDGVVGPFRVERVVVPQHPLFDAQVEELFGHLVVGAGEAGVLV